MSINCIYYLFIPDYIFNILNLIFLLYFLNILARYYIIKKYINLLLYCSFDFYLLISYLLGLNFFLFRSIIIQITL